jgi:hypothetical protein
MPFLTSFRCFRLAFRFRHPSSDSLHRPLISRHVFPTRLPLSIVSHASLSLSLPLSLPRPPRTQPSSTSGQIVALLIAYRSLPPLVVLTFSFLPTRSLSRISSHFVPNQRFMCAYELDRRHSSRHDQTVATGHCHLDLTLIGDRHALVTAIHRHHIVTLCKSDPFCLCYTEPDRQRRRRVHSRSNDSNCPQIPCTHTTPNTSLTVSLSLSLTLTLIRPFVPN